MLASGRRKQAWLAVIWMPASKHGTDRYTHLRGAGTKPRHVVRHQHWQHLSGKTLLDLALQLQELLEGCSPVQACLQLREVRQKVHELCDAMNVEGS